MGVLIHVIGDAVNNVGVIISALVIWLGQYEGRFYADPGVSIGIAILILLSSIPLGTLTTEERYHFMSSTDKILVKNSAIVLLQGAPSGMDFADIRHDLEQVCCFVTLFEVP